MEITKSREIWSRIKDNVIITYSSDKLKRYFYTIDHCQAVIRTWQKPDMTVSGEHKNWLGTDDWVACTTTIPYPIGARPAFPDGWIKTKEENANLHFSDYEEIHNPEPEYQPEENRTGTFSYG